LGQPRQSKSDENEWECPFRIRGRGVSLVEFGYGVDSMQALTTALEGIRAVLDERFGSFRWFRWEEGGALIDHSGFQRQIPLLGGAATRRLERLVDGELKRHLRQLERRTANRGRRAVKKRGKRGQE
jgi:hypothetical protein